MSASVTGVEKKSKEYLQKKLCFLKEKLRDMVHELPRSSLQQKFTEELISALADTLIDDNIYGIVMHLMNIQHHVESEKCEARIKIMKDHAAELQQLKYLSTSISKSEFDQRMNIIKEEYDQKYNVYDKSVLKALDGKKDEQQEVLSLAHIPGFQITDDPRKIVLQTKIIDFILRLSQTMKNWQPNP